MRHDNGYCMETSSLSFCRYSIIFPLVLYCIVYSTIDHLTSIIASILCKISTMLEGTSSLSDSCSYVALFRSTIELHSPPRPHTAINQKQSSHAMRECTAFCHFDLHYDIRQGHAQLPPRPPTTERTKD